MEKKFNLLIKPKNKTPFTLEVIDHILIGRDPRSDVVLTDKNASENHFELEQNDGVLILKYQGPSKSSFLNNVPLEKGKNYILEEKDIIKTSEIEIQFTSENKRVLSLVGSDENNNEELDQDNHAQREFTEHARKVSLDKLLGHDNITKDLVLETPQEQKNKKKYIEKTKIIKAAKKETKKENLKTSHFVLVKLLSVLLDFSFVYFLLTFVFPKINAHLFVIDLSNFILSFAVESLRDYHSLFYFLLPWIIISFFQILIFGQTFGQFFAGLKMNDSNSFARMFVLRLKMIFMTLFLIPGQNALHKNIFAKISRYLLSPLFIIAFIILPLYSPDLKINHFSSQNLVQNFNQSESQKVIFDDENDLSYQLSNKMILLPTLTGDEKVKKAIIFKELKTKEEGYLTLEKSFKNTEIQDFLAYANPLFSLIHSGSTDDLYTLTLNALKLNPEIYPDLILSNGPFLAGSYIFKELFTPSLESAVTTFNNKKWLAIQNDEDYFFVYFNSNALHLFKVKGENQKHLNELFIQEILANQIQEDGVHNEEISLIDSLKIKNSEDFKSLLTYYTNIVNKLEQTTLYYGNENLTFEAKSEVAKELSVLREKASVFETKDEIRNLITKLSPMETPGGNDE